MGDLEDSNIVDEKMWDEEEDGKPNEKDEKFDVRRSRHKLTSPRVTH